MDVYEKARVDFSFPISTVGIKGIYEEPKLFEKRQSVWKVLNDLFEPNLVAEIIVTFQNNDMLKLSIASDASTYKYCKTGVKLEYRDEKWRTRDGDSVQQIE